MPVSLRQQFEAVERMRDCLRTSRGMPLNIDERHEVANHLDEAAETLRQADLERITGRDLIADRQLQVKS